MLKAQSAADKTKKGAGKAMIDNERVGRNIMILRLEKGLSQQGLAEICSVTHQAVSKWENGAALPDMQTMLFLSRYFDVSIENMLTEDLAVDKPEAACLPAGAQPASPVPPMEIPEAPPLPTVPQILPEASAADAPAALGWAQIVDLAPFASQHAIDQMIRRKLSSGEKPDWEQISDLLPFAGKEMLARLLQDSVGLLDLPALESIAPFVSRDFLDRAVLSQADRLDPAATLAALAPFLSRETIDSLLLGGC